MRSSDDALVHHDLAIIGVGNVLRGDDGVAWAIALALEPSLVEQSCYLAIAHELTPELALPLSHSSLAIFIDAAADSPAGAVRCQRALACSRSSRSLLHHHDIASLLQLTHDVFGSAPEAWEITIGGQNWGHGTRLSPIVSAAIPRVLHRVDFVVACRLAALEPVCPNELEMN